MLKEKTTWVLIIFVLCVVFVGAIDHKKTVADDNDSISNLSIKITD